MKKQPLIILLAILLSFISCKQSLNNVDNNNPPQPSVQSHNPGRDCIGCHAEFKLAGTVFTDETGTTPSPVVSLSLTQADGSTITLDNSNNDGNLVSNAAPDGNYIIQLGDISCKTWHQLPGQRSCNQCHIQGGNISSERTKQFPNSHTSIPPDNECTHCHHFPTTMAYNQLMTRGVLDIVKRRPGKPGSGVEINGTDYPFDPGEYNITSVRPDVFAAGYFSMFDVILAVAERNNIPVEYHYDETCKTHFITKINDVTADYWYRFSYDCGSSYTRELRNRRDYRWDEALWRPGVHIVVVSGENVAELRQAYQEEILRENQSGQVVGEVSFTFNPSRFQGNPPESHRVSLNRQVENVTVTAHNLRSTGYPSPYSKPFQPGVVTAMDILLSLQDQGLLTVVTGVFYNHFNNNYIDSYYIVELGFPDLGTAHASGLQGFTYRVRSGDPNNPPNNASGTFHITCDINVIHAPDYSTWRWTELGNPYYESALGTVLVSKELRQKAVIEDHDSINRGFNLHTPVGHSVSGLVFLSFNIFDPGDVIVAVYNLAGKKVKTLFRDKVEELKIHRLTWNPVGMKPGCYSIVMRYKNNVQERLLTLR